MRSTDDRRGESVVPVTALGVSSGVRTKPARGGQPREPKSCYARAIDALARSARSRADLGRWLKEREYGAEEIETVLSKLEALGMLDDLAFARGFARSRLDARGFGPRRVFTELARRGVAKEIIAQVLEEHRADAEASEGGAGRAIDVVAARRMKSLGKLPRDVARRRLQGFLARRGFESGEILRVLRTIAK
jgi:regulatory protein